ncbi:MAG: hypothetical protein ACK5TQ_07560 [Acetobacteraceae bacterium]
MNDKSSSGFVDLERTFHEISSYARESDDVDVSQAFWIGPSITWADLKKERRVVLLAEAGAGKTEEIRHAAYRWRTGGEHAFFLRLEHLADDFDTAFEVGDLDDFERWKNSQDEAWVLLDSVDEARLRNPTDFERAIRKFAAKVRGAEDRLHLLITSRISAWRPRTDLEFCERLLPPPAVGRVAEAVRTDDAGLDSPADITVATEKENEPPRFRIVTIDDLDPGRIAKFALSRGITDLEQFRDAVERKDAWAYSRRPQDLLELIDFWRTHRRIGSRLELVKSSIERRLEERDQTRAEWRPLASDRVRAAAARIAAACVLTRESTIQVPDGPANGAGLRLEAVLPDWNPRELNALLNRPLFDEAIYGAVRFHHREAREYLAAEWFGSLLRRETSRTKIEALFFRRQYELDIITPTLRPVLPWLALLDDRVRDRLLLVAPEVLFEGGDPSQLPKPTREAILRACCKGLAATSTPRTFTDYAKVQRFAAPDLVETIQDLFRIYADSEEVTSFLCRMIWIGPLPDLRLKALELARRTDGSRYTRVVAVRALAAIGASDDLLEIRSKILAEGISVDRELLAELVTATLSAAEDVEWLVAALRAAAGPHPHRADRLADALKSRNERASLPLLRRLAAAFGTFLEETPYIDASYCPVSKAWTWVAGPAFEVLAKLAERRDATLLEETALALLRRVGLVKRHHYDLHESRTELGELIKKWDALKRSLFWHEVAASRHPRGGAAPETVTHFRDVWPNTGFWRFSASDFDYFVDQIATRAEDDDRAVALTVALAIFGEGGCHEHWRAALTAATARDARLESIAAAFFNPPPETEEARKWRAEEAAWKRKVEKRRQEEVRNQQDWRETLRLNVEQLRNSGLLEPPKVSQAQWYLLKRTQKDEDRSGRWANGNWKALTEEFGTAVAEAFRDGATGFWRSYDPLPLSEGGALNSTPAEHIFGLAGLAIEARESEAWPKGLSQVEAKRATRYAVGELNGFPPWLPDLFTAHTDAVLSVILGEIEHQVRTEKTDETVHYVLDDVAWSGMWCWDALGPRLLSLLGTLAPRRADSLQKLLIIVHGSTVSDQAIEELAARGIDECTSIECRAVWFASLIGTNPEHGIRRLRTYLEGLNDKADSTRLAMLAVTNLVGARGDGGVMPRQKFINARHLGDLYVLMHEHIQKREDIDRVSGGVYSPELRDNAQEAREGLLSSLDRIPGKETFLALSKLASVHPEESLRPYMVQRARRRAEADGDLSPWNAVQVREFAESLERTPQDHGELADLVLLRFLDLKAELEGGDESLAPILLKITEETEMRNFLARELRSRAGGRYHVPQESELADGKRPDLRFHGNGFDAPLPAELKLADRWTGPELLERLENQLCGDYLRDTRSRRGLFVLVHNGTKKNWILGDKTKVDFDGLVAGLAARWRQISPNFPDIDDVRVVGINLPIRAQASSNGVPAKAKKGGKRDKNGSSEG